MSLSRIDDRECPPAAFAGTTRGAHAPDRKGRPRTDTPLSGSTESVLSAREFERSIGRERRLADRGTRRFSLLVLRRRAGEREVRLGPEVLGRLGSQVCQRLRSTDLVGGIDAGRLEILLTDTEPAGAHVVALWVEQLGAILGLDLELMIYVYPLVIEPSAGRLHGSPPERVRSNRSSDGGPNRSRQGAAISKTGPRAPAEVPRTTDHRGDSDRWPMKDLWPRFGTPTPLGKRLLDILLSALALLALAPGFALIAIAIRLDSAGPVIFTHLRAGRGGRPFVFYKFRSMSRDAEEQRAALDSRNEQEGPIFKIREDPRITRVGRLLRRWSLDELPQLWNVLKGDISLVGPRSPTMDEVSKYERWHRRRLHVTGGITCTWQVSGRSRVSFRDWMRLDMHYVACRNLWLDLRLLARTLPAVISGRGAS